MEREAVDVELPQAATPQQTAWLQTTRIRLRSIAFADDITLRCNVSARQLTAAAAFTTSLDMLSASTQTLEVRPPHLGHNPNSRHRMTYRWLPRACESLIVNSQSVTG